jgi:hypothetical protein
MYIYIYIYIYIYYIYIRDGGASRMTDSDLLGTLVEDTLCVYVCVCVYIYIYIHTHTHISNKPYKHTKSHAYTQLNLTCTHNSHQGAFPAIPAPPPRRTVVPPPTVPFLPPSSLTSPTGAPQTNQHDQNTDNNTKTGAPQSVLSPQTQTQTQTAPAVTTSVIGPPQTLSMTSADEGKSGYLVCMHACI